jgi:hypothetical protein
MLVETVSDAHVHFHYSARRFRDVLLANILATQNKNKVLLFLYSFIQRDWVKVSRIVKVETVKK